jgi:energy-coupling factor transport system permease protein
MLVTWKYRPRDTIIQRLDPRARFIMLAAMVIAFTQFWDLRVVFPLFLFSLSMFLLSRIEWKDVKRAVLFIVVFATLLVIINTILGARGGPPSVRNDQSPELWGFSFIVPGVGWQSGISITAARVTFILSQYMRFLGMAFLAIPIPYTLDPQLYGATFKQMGLPDKPAYSVDLAFRMVPSLARDFNITIDAQRARGYELDKIRGGIFERLRRLAPIIVPVVIQSIVDGEEIIDAMELRGFGVGKRTWIRTLQFQPFDYLFIVLAGVIFITAIICSFAGIFTDIWIPPFLYQLAGR